MEQQMPVLVSKATIVPIVRITYRLDGQWKEELVRPDLSGHSHVASVANRLTANGAMCVTWG